MNDTIYVAVDTVFRVVPLDDTFVMLQAESSLLTKSISVGDILTLIGMFGSVAAFCWQLCKTRKERKENLRSSWFLDVVVQPNMEMINEFYDKIINDTDLKVNELSDRYESGGAAKDLNTDLAKYQRNLKDEIKTSLGHFQALVKASEPAIFNEIELVLDDLVDIVTKWLDGYEDYNKSSVKSKALYNKQQFISKLYSGWNR